MSIIVSLNDLNEEDADPLRMCGPSGGSMARRPMNDLSKNRQTLNRISSEEMDCGGGGAATMIKR